MPPRLGLLCLVMRARGTTVLRSTFGERAAELAFQLKPKHFRPFCVARVSYLIWRKEEIPNRHVRNSG